MVIGADIMDINWGETLFLCFVAMFPFVNLIKFCYFYRKLLRLSGEYPEENIKLSGLNKEVYEFIFAKDWCRNEELEYYRIQIRQSLKNTVIFGIGFIGAFSIFAFHGK